MIEDSKHFLNRNKTAVDFEREDFGWVQEKYSFDDLEFTRGDINIDFNLKAVENIIDTKNFEVVKFSRHKHAKGLLKIGYVEEMIQNYTWRLSRDMLIDIFGEDTLENKLKFQLDTIVGTIKSRAPGTGIPCHRDVYSKVKEVNEKTGRWVVALQDWNWGEFNQCDNRIIVGWKAGDAYSIPAGSEHLAINFGIRFRNLITITGDLMEV